MSVTIYHGTPLTPRASLLDVLTGRAALSPPAQTEEMVERVIEPWKAETSLDISEERNPATDEFAKGFNYGLTKARDMIYSRLPALTAALPLTGREEIRREADDLAEQANRWRNAYGEAMEVLEAIKELADGGEVQLIWESADRALSSSLDTSEQGR